MKTSLRWVNRYLDTPVSLAEFQAALPVVGFPVEGCDALADGDFKLEVEVTSNRGDVLCHLGVARELAAKLGRKLKLPDAPAAAGAGAGVPVEVRSPACPLYIARRIRGVKVGPSPAWLRGAVESIGLRSINNVVDVTNFVMFECGQPLHAFDFAKVEGGRIVVREAAGEGFTALDGSKHTLKAPHLVIADAVKPTALAGIMGGKDSEVGEATTDILLESALFEPLTIRRAARTLKMASDSSYRFERGPDVAGVEWASRRAAALILEVAGGEIVGAPTRVGAADPAPRTVTLRAGRTCALLGLELGLAEQQRLLAALGLESKAEGAVLHVGVPSRRPDLVREVDLIEEIARLKGLEAIPVADEATLSVRTELPATAARRIIGATLAAAGFHETVTPSLVSDKAAKAFAAAPAVLFGDKGKRPEGGALRPSVLCGLLTCRKANADAGNAQVKLFEVAACWAPGADGAPAERRTVALLADAPAAGHEGVQQGLRQMRGVIESLAEALGGPNAKVAVAALAGADPAAPVAEVRLGATLLGRFGVVPAAARKAFDLAEPLLFAELELAALTALYPAQREVGDLPRFPAMDRDLTVVCDEALAWEKVEATVRAADPARMESLSFLYAYRGKPFNPGQKALTLRLWFRDPARTMERAEADAEMAKVVAALKGVGAEQRV